MLKRVRLYAAGTIAVLLGVPLTQKAMADGLDVAFAALNLTGYIVDASAGQS
ncbi:MAG: hypothetical protein IPM13_06255 [Phycisphaerales bacterium]|nr:hypothetical protein [Phycisphaerales bacterium]